MKQAHPAAAFREDTCGGYLFKCCWKCSAHSPLLLRQPLIYFIIRRTYVVEKARHGHIKREKCGVCVLTKGKGEQIGGCMNVGRPVHLA